MRNYIHSAHDIFPIGGESSTDTFSLEREKDRKRSCNMDMNNTHVVFPIEDNSRTDTFWWCQGGGVISSML